MNLDRPHVLIAPDKFKGSLTSEQAGAAIAAGVLRRLPRATTRILAVADGGEGTVDVAVAAGATPHVTTVRDPLGRQVHARWALTGTTAVLELAEASGLQRVTPDSRTARNADTFGTGELILAALDAGADDIIVGVGGSATVDGGSGALRALGATILDATGARIDTGGVALREAVRLDLSGLDERLADVRIRIASDVDNPLTGEQGAARVYGPQKGATDEDVRHLDAALLNWARLLEASTGRTVLDVAGGGAAGGFSAALVATTNTTIEHGFSVVAELAGFHRALQAADLVVTGEGSFDEQSLHGKSPAAIAAHANAIGTPVLAVAGRIELSSETLTHLGVRGAAEVREVATSISDSFEHAALHVASAAALAVDRWLTSAASTPEAAEHTGPSNRTASTHREEDTPLQHHRHLHPPLSLPNFPEVPDGARIHEIANRALQDWVIRTALQTRPDTVEWVLGPASEIDASAEPAPRSTAVRVTTATARAALAECMRGRTMFVIPYRLPASDGSAGTVGVQITDSAAVVRALRAGLETGRDVLDHIGPTSAWDAHLHTTGLPLHTSLTTRRTGPHETPADPCASRPGHPDIVIGAEPTLLAQLRQLTTAGGTSA